jgi:peptide deformylase
MKLNIVQVGDPVLRQKARKLSIVEIQSEAIQELINHMKETMREAPGVGLAAPQIGLPLQLAVIEDREEYHGKFSAEELKRRERDSIPFHVIINPKLIIVETKKVDFYEGCLSIKGLVGIVPRVKAVRVECLNEKAESIVIKARGWHARILQHEIDHLHGKLCIDKTKIETLSTVENYMKYGK